MKRLRHTAPILLAALFWLAQLQGTWHSMSHLTDATHTHQSVHAAHTPICLDCAALAQAGGAPITALSSAALLSLTDDRPILFSIEASPTRTRVAYHSRAPPHTLI